MARPAVPMPVRVRVVCVALTVAVGGLAFHGVRLLPHDVLAAVPLLLMVALGLPALAGAIRGRPLAWQAARLFGGLLAMGSTPFVVTLPFTGGSPTSLLFFVCGLLVVTGLSRPAAAQHFDLYCGYCKSTDARPVGFWFRAVECRKCGKRWKPHSARVDPDVFD